MPEKIPVITEKALDSFVLLSDALIHETVPEKIEQFLDEDFPKDKIEEYARNFPRPSTVPQFRQEVLALLNAGSVASTEAFLQLSNLLESKFLSPPVTNSVTLVKDMDIHQREKLLQNWRDSPFAFKRKLFRLFHLATFAIYSRIVYDLHNQAMGYPMREKREELYEGQTKPDFQYEMQLPPSEDGAVLNIDVDAVIIGSGCGAGVVAHTLAQDGHRSLVLDKGPYFHPSELNFNDYEGMRNMYELAGGCMSNTQEMVFFAASAFGGGSTINWSACLKPSAKVRKEWKEDYGVDWVEEEVFDECLDYVWKKMGASSEGVEHSFTNQVILDGSRKLGFDVEEVAQNSGGHKNHNCGFCHLGCKYGIKQGGVACWFRDAAENGCKFMDLVKVEKILHENGKANGLLCKDVRTGKSFTIRGPKKYIVSSGTLNTPIVLQKSGFTNKNIGDNFKCHPVQCMFGDFGKEHKTKPYANSILTTACNQLDDLDGKAHGPKIEACLQAPYLQAPFMTWESSDKMRQDMLKYNNISVMIVITRDLGHGQISYDKKKPDAFSIDYEVSEYDRKVLLEGVVTASDIMYIEGAKEIFNPQYNVPNFKSDKPKESRSIVDEDYVAWRKKVASTPLDLASNQLGSAHQMASCRLSGKGPEYGAADLDGRLYEAENVFVADASSLPTATGVNPMISTMAFARKISLGISKELTKEKA
ncbi:long-chain fatty alcohol dehydrogenase [Hyphopichia burtonii NRRL Y-1933]|uniref:Long-chain-alcohol oxidase n=1 Tax=Hyphopichia burtonii NRRL Y-1933 TaxID=984485 RepID=A0A1E4RIS7_9ASCO|nr:long-chain fatty alcohol dehydrogenase [Hyphopichia burtonii NRRL Y-1933]ODV67174.1 long-chain fatty alcohol dehydrogenase [Hyphopichia burtonii NRRL Y-1933]